MIAGSDEAGKGDYFGYVVVACVACDEEALVGMGVKDSKRLSGNQVMKIEREIKRRCIYSVVSVSPRRYNELHVDTGGKYNLNQILGWMHARAIKDVLRRAKPERIVVDKFGDESNVLANIEGVQLLFKTGGGMDPAVAAASILARAEFLRRHAELSEKVGISLPRGATAVKDAAREIVRRKGEDALWNIAKVHFRVTKQL